MPKRRREERNAEPLPVSDLEERLGYGFSDRSLLERALTHASARGSGEFHYERTEFLGDRVLGLAVADLIYRNFPDVREGELSVRHNLMVKGKTLVEISDSLKLYDFIRVGPDIGDLKSKRLQNLRADVLEAVIGSIYLDGGLEPALDFVGRIWRERLHDPQAARRDAKTALQEWTHTARLGLPKYTKKSRSGPDHEPDFVVVVRVAGIESCEGRGTSKRSAEQAAAQAMLVREGVWSKDGKIL